STLLNPMRRTSPSACRGARQAYATPVSPTSAIRHFAARRFANTAVLALAAALVGSTQAADAPASDTVILSPFEVNSSSDVGFVAANSLAGGRMAGPLE